MIITIPTYRKVMYHGQVIEVPLWVKYIAMSVRMRGNKADLIGFSHKPYLTVTHCNWFISKDKKEPREEIIGHVTGVNVDYNDELFHRRSLLKLPEM